MSRSLVLGVVLMEARQSLLTPEGLCHDAPASALADPRVSAYVADRATNAVLAAQPDLTAFRPVVAAVAAATVSSHPFQRAIQASIRSAVAAVPERRQQQDRAVDSGSWRPVSQRAVAGEPSPGREDSDLGCAGPSRDLGDGWASRAIVDLLRLSRRLAGFVAVLFGLGAACIAGGFALARDRRRALLDASVHLIAAGVVLLVLRAAGGGSCSQPVPIR